MFLFNILSPLSSIAFKKKKKKKKKAEVLGPIVLDVSIPDIKDAICFERAVPRWLLVGFVVQNEVILWW